MEQRRTCGNENTGMLKIVAMICMALDHVGKVLLPLQSDLRIIGRIAFPLYIWCLVVGTEYTRNIWKYALRLLLMGILSQPFFAWAFSLPWYALNVFVTLFMGLMAIAGIREKRYGSQLWAPALTILCAAVINMDYGWQGVLLIILMYLVRKERGGLIAMMIGFCLFWGQQYAVIETFFGIPLPRTSTLLPQGFLLLNSINRMQFWAILALPLMLLPSKRRISLPKWFTYGFYPAHLAMIAVIRHWRELMDALARWM